MSLAYYGTLVAGPSGVATIRFSTPVILNKIRIIPAGVSAFKHVKNCAGETTPAQFSLKIYSNALALPTDAEPKPKASNTLLSTQVDHVDEMLDWSFVVSPTASSRLVIFQGSFEKLTIAIYGQLLSDVPTEQSAAAIPPAAFPVITPLSLPPAIDVATLPDSSQTAKSLLRANPAYPPLRHVLHSMLCYVTTPEGPFDEWEENSGNPLEKLLESDTIDSVELMQQAIQALRKPLPEVEGDTATQFTALVNESLGENPDAQTCKLLFEILGYASLQSDPIVTAVLYGISTVTYLGDPRLIGDDETTNHIERWISHPLVARYLNEPDTREYMLAGRDQPTSAENMARWERLLDDITYWGEFHSTLEQSEFDTVPRISRWIRHSLSRRHFGPTLVWRLWNTSGVAEFPSNERDYMDLTLGAHHDSFDAFGASLKTFMGVASVLAVVWWSRFPPDAVACRAVSILKLWAESSGIREIVRSLVLVPIFHEALSELSVEVPLHKSGLYAQQLLDSLNISIDGTDTPEPTQSEPISEPVPATPEPSQLSGHLEVISAILRQAKLDGVAIKRISLASQRVLSQVVDGSEEAWSIFEDAHIATGEAFIPTQIEVLRKLDEHMGSASASVLANLLPALANILETIALLVPFVNLALPVVKSLILSTAKVFIAAELVVSRNQRQPTVLDYAHTARQSCVQVIRTLVTLDESGTGFKYPGAEHVLPQLLTVWSGPAGCEVVDSTIHVAVSQTAVLLDLLLPQPGEGPGEEFWVREFVRVFPRLEQLLAILSPRHWTTLVTHLVRLDSNRSVGLGERFALNETRALKALVARITLDAGSGKLSVMLRVADRSLGLLVVLVKEDAGIAELLVRDPEAISALVQCLEVLADNHATTALTAALAAALAPHAGDEPRALRRLLTTTLLRGCRFGAPTPYLVAIPQLLMSHRTFATRDMDLDVFGADIGLALVAVCANGQLTREAWDSVTSVLEWLTDFEEPTSIRLYGLDSNALDTIRQNTQTTALDVLSLSSDVPEDFVALPQPVVTTADVRAALSRTQSDSRESTPVRDQHTQFDILALASISPRAPISPVTPSAPLSLTKMYSQNEFRLLRHSPSARLNTSRPPSQHVDDWQAQTSDVEMQT